MQEHKERGGLVVDIDGTQRKNSLGFSQDAQEKNTQKRIITIIKHLLNA